MISLRPLLITVHHSVSSLNDPAREAWLGKPGTPVGLIRRHRERRLDKHALILYPTESGEKTVLGPSTGRQTPVTKSFSTKNNTA
jgi:hypothetical protein